MALQLGTATYTYLYDTDLRTAVDRIADLGFQTCELMMTPPHLSPDELDAAGRRALRRRIEDRGLTLCAIQPGYLDLNIASMIPRLRRQSDDYLRDFIDLAADLGSHFFVLGTGRRHPLIPAPFEPLYAEVREVVAELVDHAQDRGVVITLENIPTNFVERGEQVRALCEEIASDACRILYDVANGHMVEDPAQGLRDVAPYLAYVHISDTARDRWEHTRVGSRDVDFAAVTAALQEIGYEGPSVLEVLDPGAPDDALEDSARQLEELGWRR